MAPIGGGPGGGGPTSSSNSFTGTASSVDYIGNQVYGYSGLKQIATSFVTHFEYTSGSKYTDMRFVLSGTIGEGDISSGGNSVYMLHLNGTKVQQVKIGSSGEAMPTTINLDVIIPPYTEVKLDCLSNAATSNYFTAASCVGIVKG